MPKLSLGLQQKLQQRLSPQQIQVIRLLEIPTLQLEQRVKRELEENPTLEEGSPHADEENYDSDGLAEAAAEEQSVEPADDEFSLEDYISDDDEFSDPGFSSRYTSPAEDAQREEMPFAAFPSFRDQLVEQLGYRRIDPEQRKLAEYIVGNLDADGYLRRELQSLADDLLLLQGLDIPVEELEKALRVVQTLEPKGIGATSLEECLLIQLQGNLSPAAERARTILQRYSQLFFRKHYDRLQSALGLSDVETRAAIDEILRLNPKPGDLGEGQQSPASQSIVPDFILSVDDAGELTLSLHAANMPELRVNRQYANMLRAYAAKREKASPEEREAAQFVRKKIDSARWFIDAIQQRNTTLLAVMHAIINYQRDYFLEGDPALLRPLILKDIADVVGVDISTVSRVVSSKYVQTPFGIRLLKDFFSEGTQNLEGEDISTREVKAALREIVDTEDKLNPLTDDQLTEALAERGYGVARRTVAKYRSQLRIPVARLRRTP